MRKVVFTVGLFCSMLVMAQDMEAIIKGERSAYEAKKELQVQTKWPGV